jgi:hypothetical protein
MGKIKYDKRAAHQAAKDLMTCSFWTIQSRTLVAAFGPSGRPIKAGTAAMMSAVPAN